MSLDEVFESSEEKEKAFDAFIKDLKELNKENKHALDKINEKYLVLKTQYLNKNILNLDCYKLTQLPDSICTLKSLEELELYNNKLFALPESIGSGGLYFLRRYYGPGRKRDPGKRFIHL